MGEIVVNIGLENPVDRINANRGISSEEAVRRTRVDAIVDTGAVALVLPQNVVERLGVEAFRTVVADERKDERPVAGPFTIEVCDRSMTTDCIVGPPFSQPLIGQIILEMLDLIPDPTNRTLAPRMPDYPLLNLK